MIRVFLWAVLLWFVQGCSTVQPDMRQSELIENKIVHTGDAYSKALYEKKLKTKGYKTLRLFVHINNEAYRSNPISENAEFKVIAYYAIGQGSWGYYDKTFTYRSTSGWSGVADIPVVGDVTRISVYASKMQNKVLKVDIVATLF